MVNYGMFLNQCYKRWDSMARMTIKEYLEWRRCRDILTGKEQRYDEMGFPDDRGEYDAGGFPLPIT